MGGGLNHQILDEFGVSLLWCPQSWCRMGLGWFGLDV